MCLRFEEQCRVNIFPDSRPGSVSGGESTDPSSEAGRETMLTKVPPVNGDAVDLRRTPQCPRTPGRSVCLMVREACSF